jgi:hypothetical protein
MNLLICGSQLIFLNAGQKHHSCVSITTGSYQPCVKFSGLLSYVQRLAAC